MTQNEFRDSLAALGLSQARLSRLLQTDKATPNRWASGSVEIPRAVVLLLRTLEGGKTTIEELEAI